jgi:hypothetical protein
LYALYYARPLVFGSYNEHWRIRVNPSVDYDYPAQLALEGWMMLLLGWEISKPRLRRVLMRTYDPRKVRRAAIVFALLGPLVIILQFATTLPVIIAGIAMFLYSLGYFGIGLLMAIVAGKSSDMLCKVELVVVTVVLILLQLLSGFITGFLVTALVLFFSYWSVKGRLSIPLVATAVLALLFTVVVKGSLTDYRRIAWVQTKGLSTTAKIDFLWTLTSNKVQNEGLAAAAGAGMQSSAKRSANMDLMADVVRRTPSKVPYWNGATYVSLIGLAIPRFLWPSKPTKALGQDFGHRYSLLDEGDRGTSFNFPFLIEFYANFGEIGIVLGMFLVGVIYGRISRVVNRPSQDSFRTMAGIVLILPLLNIESDFSLSFGGLILNGFALWLVIRMTGAQISSGKSKAPLPKLTFGPTGPPRPALGGGVTANRLTP